MSFNILSVTSEIKLSLYANPYMSSIYSEICLVVKPLAYILMILSSIPEMSFCRFFYYLWPKCAISIFGNIYLKFTVFASDGFWSITIVFWIGACRLRIAKMVVISDSIIDLIVPPKRRSLSASWISSAVFISYSSISAEMMFLFPSVCQRTYMINPFFLAFHN